MNFFILSFTLTHKMKKYFLYISLLSLIILAWCWETETETPQNWTWWIETWWARDSLIQDYSEDMVKAEEPVVNTWVEATTNTTEEKVEEVEEVSETNSDTDTHPTQNSEETTWATNENLSWNITPKPARQSWFWVEECDRIIDFNLCVISKAPIENQETMKLSLQKAVEPRKILANAQLREVCQKTIDNSTFKEVVNHYESLEDWCQY